MSANHSTIKVDSFQFDSKAFAKACTALTKGDKTITEAIYAAHKFGRSALCEVIASLSTVPELSQLAVQCIRTAACRARKGWNSEFTITASKHKNGTCFELVRSAEIQRAAGAGRKSAVAKPESVEQADHSGLNKAHAQRDTAIASAKRLADALRYLGLSDANLAALANGKLKNAELRNIVSAKLSPALPAAKRATATRKAG